MSSDTALNLFQHLCSTYGAKILSIVNNRIYMCKLEASWINHRIFNLRCIQTDLIPKSLHMRPPDSSLRSIRAAHVAERTFLRQRIHHCTVRLQQIRDKIVGLDGLLRQHLSEEDLLLVTDLITRRFAQRLHSVKQRQIRKFNRLVQARPHSSRTVQRRTDDAVIKPVVNLSDRVLTPTEENLLNKGLNFNISPGLLKPLDIIPAVEEALNLLPDNEANKARLQITRVISNQKPQTSNLTSDEKKALRSLRSDRSIVITKSDKGNQIVVMNRHDYDQKAEEHIQSGPYKLIPKEKQTSSLNKTKAIATRFLGKVKQKLGKSLWFTLNPKTSSASRFYGLPKLHKPMIPLRPIVDYTTSPTYALAKYLTHILKPLEWSTEHTVKNSIQLVDKVKGLELNVDECFVSFDITALFTNVPVNESLEIIRERLLEDPSLPERTTLSVDEILEATKICIESTYFKFKGDLFQQIAGLAMGSPISPIVANIFMQNYEKRMLVGFENPPRVWLRYVDDTLVVIRENLLDEFMNYLNDFHSDIKFTIEKESEGHTIQFLDCAIRRNEDGSIDTSVYRKASHSNRYLAFDSEHPLSTKKAVASNLYHRAMVLSSSEYNREKEKEVVTSILMANGYNNHVLEEARNNRDSNNQRDKEWLSTVVIPYRKSTSEDLRRILNQYNIRVAFQATNTLRQQLVKLKDPITSLERSNCVYKLKCKDCEACYVGQTARDLDVRVKEHRRCTTKLPIEATRLKKLENDSAIALHAMVNDHRIDFDHPHVLKHGFRTYKQRLVSEAVLITTTPSVVNRSDGFELSPIWRTLCPSHPPRTS